MANSGIITYMTENPSAQGFASEPAYTQGLQNLLSYALSRAWLS